MTHSIDQHCGYAIRRQQYQMQRQQQQKQELQHPYIDPGSPLPAKEHQSKHNPVSEMSQFGWHSCEQ
jgi:hypothetical protein